MIPYLLAFLASALMGCIASASSGRCKTIIAIAACLPLALLAGFRSITVGVDTSYYPLDAYYRSLVANPFDVMRSMDCEPGFLLIIWVLSRLTRDYNVVLFILQLFILLLVVVPLVRENSLHIGTALVVYACIFLPWSFNIMRQSLAAAVLLPAFGYAVKKKAAPFTICIGVAASLHITGLIGVLIWPICALSTNKNKQMNQLLVVFFCLLSAVLVCFIVFGASLLDYLSVFKESYSHERLGQGQFNVLFTLYPLLLALGDLVVTRSNSASNADKAGNRSLRTIMLLTFCLSFLSLLSEVLFRVGYMFLIFAPAQVSSLLSCTKSTSTRQIAVTMILLASAFVFVWAYCLGNAAGAYPYRSDILAIG